MVDGTETAFQPLCQMARDPSITKKPVSLAVGTAILERVAEARALDRDLVVPLDLVGELDAEAVVDRRRDVGRMAELVADFALRADPVGPRHDHRVGDSASKL